MRSCLFAEASKPGALFALLLSMATPSQAASPQCSAAALARAEKLLQFHSDGDDRAEVHADVRQLPSLTNPVNRKQKFLVLEVPGSIYKGQYRMRFIYFLLGRDCVLMGEEILQLADL